MLSCSSVSRVGSDKLCDPTGVVWFPSWSGSWLRCAIQLRDRRRVTSGVQKALKTVLETEMNYPGGVILVNKVYIAMALW